MSEPRLLTLGHSPDPDDAFMFYALAENKIPTGRWRFEHTLQDIQTLNERATRGELHISAVSIHAYSKILDQYALLPCGASMGDGYGPMLIVKKGVAAPKSGGDAPIREWLATQRIVLPGLMTSAYLALKIFLGAEPANTYVAPFDQIFDEVAKGNADVGLIIHEGQLTYAREGFELVRDLGAWWKEDTGLPLPLGGNVIRKDFTPDERSEINKILFESIRYGLEHRQSGVRHAMPLARGMDEALADQFIGMYVNDFTLDYGETGRRAIRTFLGRGHELGFLPNPVELEFVV